MRLGFFLASDTPFAGIKAVPPNARLRWNRDGLSIDSKPPMPDRVASIGRDEAMVVYQELFTAAIRRRSPDGVFGSLLSGGRDSRKILFELLNQHKKPDLVATLDLANSSDANVSSEIAQAFGLHHLRVPALADSVASEIRRVRETQRCADEHGWMLGLNDALKGRAAILYDGLGGDVLSAGLFLHPRPLELMRSGQFVALARHLIAEESVSSFIGQVFLGDSRLFTEEAAVHTLAKELKHHADAPNPIGSFYFWNRTRRKIALSPFSILADFKVYVPFLDHELFDFLASLPAEYFLDHTFHDQTIARSYPQWSHFRYSAKAQPALSLSNAD